MLKVSGLRLLVGEDEAALKERAARRLGVRPSDISHFRILRKALDVRDKKRLEHVYTAAVTIDDEESILARSSGRQLARFTPVMFETPQPGSTPMKHRPVVVGAGPAGLFAAYFLAEHGYAPIVLERGRPAPQRIRDADAFDRGGPLDPESNYLFGEGGAGTFSDGKLTCRSTGPDVDRVLEIFAESKGKPSILYEARPHLGSNRLPAVVKAIRRKIEAMGGEFRFSCRLDDLNLDGRRIVAIETTAGRIDADVVVLAIGHSARDTYEMLLRHEVAMAAKPFQMGARIEQPQEQVTRVQYGSSPAAALLGPADYSLKVRIGEHDLFTFCMCAGGYVMPSVSQPEQFCTNGMSRSRHESPFANSGLVVTVDPAALSGRQFGDDPLRGIRFQAAIERSAYSIAGGDYRCPIQAAKDFIAQKVTRATMPSSYCRGVASVNLWEFLPAEVSVALRDGLPEFDCKWNGKFLEGATLVGPEARGSCPVRIERDPVSRASVNTEGLYPIGEGAGFAGGIVSAAVDGLCSAKAIMREYQPTGR